MKHATKVMGVSTPTLYKGAAGISELLEHEQLNISPET